MHPTQIEHAIDLANQMVRRHNLVQIKGIKELALSILPPTHHATLPMMIDSVEWNHGSPCASMGLLQHNRGNSGRGAGVACSVFYECAAMLSSQWRTRLRDMVSLRLRAAAKMCLCISLPWSVRA